MSNPDPKEVLRASLKETWKRVPARLNAASVQDVRAYKKAYADIQKLLGKSGATLSELMGATNKTNIIYQ